MSLISLFHRSLMCSVTSNPYFTIVSLEDGLTVKLSQNASEYRIDGGEWVRLNANVATPSVNTGQKIQFKIDNPTITNTNGIGRFDVNKRFNIEGNIMSLLYGDNFKNIDLTDISRSNCVFYKLFFNCRTLQNAEKLILPATTLSNGCYQYMFYGCSSLKTAPELPAKTLATSCYMDMFYGCTALETAPELPATTLKTGCYMDMFYGCTALETAPELPAKTLANYCYDSMFYGCSSLKTAPELPTTTLADRCYEYMFYGCAALEIAPELKATTLANGCYSNMFSGCGRLNHIMMLATDISATDCLNNWVNGVARDGSFVKKVDMTLLSRGVNGIPEGWNIIEYYVKPSFINVSETSVDFNYNNGKYKPDAYNYDLSNNLDDLDLLSMQPECDIYVDIVYVEKNTGEIIAENILWKNTYKLIDVLTELSINIEVVSNLVIIIVDVIIPEDNGYYYIDTNYSTEYFTIEALEDGLTVKLSQNASEYRIDGGEWVRLNANVATPSVNTGQKIQFKINGPSITNTTGIGTFTVNKTFNIEGNIMSLLLGDLFKEQIDISRQNYVFYKLFFNCRTLQNAENLILPATILPNGCYQYMFSGCTALITAPKILPATTLANSCYSNMFEGCGRLTTTPELPAITLSNSCYYSMFSDCTSLTTTPELPATTLSDYCYSYMFSGCISLVNTPIELPAIRLTPYCYESMFSGCNTLETAPILPAQRLTEGCYMYMFERCVNLNFITMLAVDVRANDCLYDWVYDVAPTGIFVKSSDIDLPIGTDGIPEGWRVQSV